MNKKKYNIPTIISTLYLIFLWINWSSCTDSNQSADQDIRKTTTAEITSISYSYQTDSQKTDISPSVVSKPQKAKRIIRGKYDGKVRVQVDLFYCKIENKALLNLLKSNIRQVSYKDRNKQKFAYIDSGLRIRATPITIFKSEIIDFSRSNFFTVIDDSIEIVIGAEDTRSARYLKSWIKIDSTKTRKCEIYCDTMCYEGFIDPPHVKREEIYYTSYIVSKNDSGKITPTEEQLDSIAYAKKIRETF